MSINVYDHEDAFKEANLCAGKLTNLPEALKVCYDKNVARVVIADLQKKYEHLFQAFVEGVAWGRANPK